MRNAHCPICGQSSTTVLQLRFGAKMQLPTDVEVRHCAHDNFLFVTGGRQSDYDAYYAAVANDTVHQEVAVGAVRSPISILQKDHLVAALDGEPAPRSVLDFGCGEASLLVELATHFPSSRFVGFDPGPAASKGSRKAAALGLDNLSIAGLEASARGAPYDLVIASHVIEHVIDFDMLTLLHDLVTEDGLLYVEVPNPLKYAAYERREFLYYFDRLHVNHFTPQALARLLGRYGFGAVKHFEYAFPYRDDGQFPALGMLFRKGLSGDDLVSPSLLDEAQGYIRQEKARAKTVAGLLETFEGILVWGAGDNFRRSVENGGPLANCRNMVVLDRRPGEVTFGDVRRPTVDPRTGVQSCDWPVVATVSEARSEIGRQLAEIDPARRLIFI